jgi:tetrahydromethanopterin S-methyltransferase subunit C
MGMAKVGSLVGGVVVLAIVAVIGYFMSRNDAENASVGDCLPASVMEDSTADISTVETTDCAGADAAYRVMGTYQQTDVEFDLDEATCAQYPTTENAVWIGERGRTGTVLCLETVTH